MNVSESKKELRSKIRLLKKQADRSSWEQHSTVILGKVQQVEAFRTARRILIYWSLPDEVDTRNAVRSWALSKGVYLPVIDGDALRIVKYTGETNMEAEKSYGILEPTATEEAIIGEMDLIIVPGVAFDSKCNRMGRGKGYYDRLLKESVAVKIGISFDFQIVDTVPCESFDIPLDGVITETREFWAKTQ